jgi:ABC-type lipoprotein release transport system permease subunit
MGSVVGLVLTFPAVGGFQEAMPKGWFPVFYVEPATVVFGCVAGLLVGLSASLIPARRAIVTRIVEGLRYVG